MHIFFETEIVTLPYIFYNCRGGGIGSGVVNRYADIFYLGADGKTKQKHLCDGHSQYNEHGPAVAKYMVKFFLYECDELFHNQF